jgi:hypothetical protein
MDVRQAAALAGPAAAQSLAAERPPPLESLLGLDRLVGSALEPRPDDGDAERGSVIPRSCSAPAKTCRCSGQAIEATMSAKPTAAEAPTIHVPEAVLRPPLSSRWW